MDEQKLMKMITEITKGSTALQPVRPSIQFSKKYQIIKLILFFLTLTFCVVWRQLFQEMPPTGLIVTALVVIGFGDAPYEFNSATEKKARIEAEADKYEAEMRFQNQRNEDHYGV